MIARRSPPAGSPPVLPCRPTRCRTAVLTVLPLLFTVLVLLPPSPPRAAAAAAATLQPLTPPRSGKVTEWRLTGVPAATNVFDPDVIAVDAFLTGPAGEGRSIPGFWYRPYSRELRAGEEVLTPGGDGEWRLRTYLLQPGQHQLRATVRLAGAPPELLAEQAFEVIAAATPPRGFPVVAPQRQYFATTDGRPFPLVGADTCWHGRRGTYDYDTWIPAMAASGWNWGRLWMWPHSFGLETAPAERLNYRLDRAWQLDRVLALAEAHGMVMLLCLDYHGMFETQPDYWGGNNLWPQHPYNAAHGGPCATPREFFTSPAARLLYQKRLRYLVARYGASPALFAWQFLNEIDNVYRHLDAGEVARWHDTMGTWLKANDPWRRLVTTSLTGGSDRPEIWSIPALDFAVYHSYAESSPARRLATVTDSMRRRYGKPVLIGEAGVDWRGWNRASDPFLRGFRQLLWGGVAAGSAGTSMSWWWESIHSDNAYPTYRALTNVLAGTSWGTGAWDPLLFRRNPPPPSTVGDPLPAGAPFDALLRPDANWGTRLSGTLAVPNPASAGDAPGRLNAFVHGTAHPDLRIPCRIEAWFGEAARIVLHLNSVSDGAILAVRMDGAEVFRRALPNRDGKWDVNNEYNEDIAVPVSAGRHTLEIRNAGSDWFHFDSIRLERVRPARYGSDWSPAPSATGIHRGSEALVYLVAPGVEYPAQATVSNLPPATGMSLTVSNLPAGDYAAVWFRPADGQVTARTPASTTPDGLLTLAIPEFTDDLACHVFLPPALKARGMTPDGAFQLRLEGVRTGDFAIEASPGLRDWESIPTLRTPGAPEASELALDPGAARRPGRFYRLRFDAPPH